MDSKQDHRGAELYCRLASIQSRQLDFKEAKLNFEKSYLFLARFDNPTQKLFNDLNYCEYLLLTEQVELAIKKLIDLVKASQEAGLLETKIHALYYLSKAYHLQCDLQKQSIIDQEYQSNLLQLELEAQSQLINDMRWFENYISKQMNHIVLMSNQIITTISERQMQKSEQQTLDFCLYINFVTQEAYYFQEKLALFSKKILVKVLLYLIKNHKRQVDSQELYQAIWKKHYNPEIDSTLRVNMIRLRALLLDSQHKKLITSPKRNTYQIILPKSYRILYQDLDQKMKE
ncbi:winged helix-turn-helix domain-containing protein [bacterium]|nr:winged helix-turn-helix domain-containing protein [bacterium]